jgi:hypothetical protein
MNIPKLVGAAGAVLLVLAFCALPASAAGLGAAQTDAAQNQYGDSADCPNCTGDCVPNDYDWDGEQGPHGESSGVMNGEPIQHQSRFSTGSCAGCNTA